MLVLSDRPGSPAGQLPWWGGLSFARVVELVYTESWQLSGGPQRPPAGSSPVPRTASSGNSGPPEFRWICPT